MWEKVEAVIEDLRPMLWSDGGDCEVVDIMDGVVSIRLKGACGSCPSSTVTLKHAIERTLIEEVPGIVGVVQVSDDVEA